MFAEGTGDVDVAKANMVEAELDSFVARRDKERRRDEGERLPEEIWQESVRAYNARQEAERRAATVAYLLAHADRVENIAAVIAAEKRAQAHKLMQDEPKGA
jgi:hypothetical protein